MMLLLLSSGLLVFGFFVLQWVLKYFWMRKKLSKIPGPTNIPFVGLSRKIMSMPREERFMWFKNLCYQYENGIVLTWIGLEPFVTIRKPRQMEIILRSNTLITKASMYDALREWLGEGLITSTGEHWFNHRRLITPAFHFGVLEEYAAVMHDNVEVLVECIEKESRENPNGLINIFELAVRYTLDTICETAMGINIDTQRNPNNDYVSALHEFARLSSERFIRPWLKWDWVYDRTPSGKARKKAAHVMHDFTEKVIRQKQSEREKNKSSDGKEFDEVGQKKRKAFLDLLLDACESSKHQLSFKELREEVDTFMFAGHDTTSAGITWALFTLANEPDVQRKVHEELKEVFDDSDETATTKQLAQLRYLDRVIKEALRMYPSAPSVSRVADTDTYLDGYFIPKGTVISIHIYQLHHDPEVWEDPERFDPDRFLPENSRGRHPYAYIPFSAGPRNCIGQKFALLELKTALTAILRKWRVTSPLKPSEVKMIHNFILRPMNGVVELSFTPVGDTNV